MKTLALSLLIAGTAFLTGCEEETKSYAWYKDHETETYRVHEKCVQSGSDSKNCHNARRAFDAFQDAKRFGIRVN